MTEKGKNSMINDIPTKIYRGEGFMTIVTYNNKGDLLYIGDFVEALQIVMEKETEMFQVYNVGSNKVYSVLEVLDIMKEIAQYSAPTEFIKGKPSMIPTRKIDSNKIKEKLGWECKTSLKTGLSIAYDWYLNHQNEFKK